MTVKKNWFVANDAGNVAGHDMSEMSAKLLAEQMKEKKTFYICYAGSSGDGYVAYDGTTCHSLDMAMTFDNEENAKSECEKLQSDWESELYVNFISDDSWEAMSSDEE